MSDLRQVSIFDNNEDWEALRRVAFDRKVSASALVRAAISNYLMDVTPFDRAFGDPTAIKRAGRRER